MGRQSQAVNLRIVAHADNLTDAERKIIADVCMKRDILHRDITGICFVDDDRMVVLQLVDEKTIVHDLTKKE